MNRVSFLQKMSVCLAGAVIILPIVFAVLLGSVYVFASSNDELLQTAAAATTEEEGNLGDTGNTDAAGDTDDAGAAGNTGSTVVVGDTHDADIDGESDELDEAGKRDGNAPRLTFLFEEGSEYIDIDTEIYNGYTDDEKMNLLMQGLSVYDENGNPVDSATLQSNGGFNINAQAPDNAFEIIYMAAHPDNGLVFTETRTVYRVGNEPTDGAAASALTLLAVPEIWFGEVRLGLSPETIQASIVGGVTVSNTSEQGWVLSVRYDDFSKKLPGRLFFKQGKMEKDITGSSQVICIYPPGGQHEESIFEKTWDRDDEGFFLEVKADDVLDYDHGGLVLSKLIWEITPDVQ